MAVRTDEERSKPMIWQVWQSSGVDVFKRAVK
jgi:hypothetical protein